MCGNLQFWIRIACKGNIHRPIRIFNLFFFLLFLCSLIDTSYLFLLHPLWLRSLVCHSSLGIQMSLVHREQNSFPPSLCFLLSSVPSGCVSECNCVSPHSMTASGVLHPAPSVFAPEGVSPAMLTLALPSPAMGTRSRSPQLESAAQSVAVMEVKAMFGPQIQPVPNVILLKRCTFLFGTSPFTCLLFILSSRAFCCTLCCAYVKEIFISV